MAASATVLHRTYTPLAFREQTERRLILALASLAAVVWLLVIPLELALHEPGTPPVAATAEQASPVRA